MGCNVRQACLRQIADLFIQRAHRADQLDALRQDIVALRVTPQGADRHHDLFDGVYIARRNALQGHHHMGSCQIGVYRLMRGGRMTALPVNNDLKLIGCGQQRAFADGELAHGIAGHVVHAIDLFDPPTVHHAVLDHFIAAAAALFGGLEDQHTAAIEIAGLGQILRGPQQHRRMTVVAAGVHLARHGRGMGQACGLHDRQRIHISAQPHSPVRCVLPPLDDSHNAGLSDTLGDVGDPEAAQLFNHKGCGFMHVKFQLWMCV